MQQRPHTGDPVTRGGRTQIRRTAEQRRKGPDQTVVISLEAPGWTNATGLRQSALRAAETQDFSRALTRAINCSTCGMILSTMTATPAAVGWSLSD